MGGNDGRHLRIVLAYLSALENFWKADGVLKLFVTGLLNPTVLTMPPFHLRHHLLLEYRLGGENRIWVSIYAQLLLTFTLKIYLPCSGSWGGGWSREKEKGTVRTSSPRLCPFAFCVCWAGTGLQKGRGQTQSHRCCEAGAVSIAFSQ